MNPVIEYVRLGSARVAYQIIGDGPVDMVLTAGSFGSFDVEWEDVEARAFFEHLGSFCRLIRFDRRGTGASDPLPLDALPPWEAFVEEVDAVMDAAGSQRAVIFAALDAGTMALLFAATRPERTVALVLAQTTARYLASDDYPIGIPPQMAEQLVEAVDGVWGTEDQAAQQVPSRAHDPRFRRWYARLARSIASPAAARAYFRAVFETDARPLLGQVKVPTLVLHRTDYPFIPFEHGRYLAEHIDGAKLVELPGSDGPLIWDHAEETLDAIEEFVTGAPSHHHRDTFMGVVVVTATEPAVPGVDVPDSESVHAGGLDAPSVAILEDVADGFEARVLAVSDGLAIFAVDGPGRAVRVAGAVHRALAERGIAARSGLHVGELARGDTDGGFVAQLATSIMSEAAVGEILVSRTIRDLVVGSDIALDAVGVRRFGGSAEDWMLYRVRDPS